MNLEFSATIGCYKNDDPEYFKNAFLSIYNQTIRPSEIIITVDGPIPEELNKLICGLEIKYREVVVLRSEVNQGLGLSHARAISKAKYDYVAIMDADDISTPNRFEKQLHYLCNHPETDVIGGQIDEFIDFAENVVGIRKVPLSNEDIKKYLKLRCPFNHMSIIVKKTAVMNVGNYQDWHYNEDYFLYCRMLLNDCVFSNLPDILCHVRVGKEMYKRRGGWKYFKSEANLQIWMLKNKIISFPRYLINVFIRFGVQVLMPNWLRGFIFKKFARKSK